MIPSQEPHTDPSTVTPIQAMPPPAAAFVRHRVRPAWGLGALLADAPGKRTYRFEDGATRTFKRGYYHMLTPTKPPASMSDLELRELAAAAAAGAQPGLRAQLEIFLASFPGGFEDPRWLADRRGVAARRALGRHREPVLRSAAERLAARVLDQKIAAGEHQELWDDVVDLLASTDLVPPSQRRGLMASPTGPALSQALRDFLHGAGDEGQRFEAMRRALPAKVWSWALATTLRALVDPLGEAPVRPSAFATQARAIGAEVVNARIPSARAYHAHLRLARDIRDWLISQGLRPRDLIDVHDFIWETTRPAAQKAMKARALRRGGEASRPEVADAA